MSYQVKKIEAQTFNVANEINNDAKMVKAASSHLRDSYLSKTNNSNVNALRKNVFNTAMVYNYKIVPFAEVTITNIIKFCEMAKHDDYVKFKKKCKMLVKHATKSEKFCEYTYLFHVRILSEIKKLQDLNYRIGESMSLGIDSLTPTLCNVHQKPHVISDSPEEVLKSVKNSIDYYINSLEKFTGFFVNLYRDLTMLKDYSSEIDTNDDEEECHVYYDMVNINVQRILDVCNNYNNSVRIASSDLDCIDEDSDKIYINGWILNVVKKNYGNDADLRKLIAANENLIQICGYQ